MTRSIVRRIAHEWTLVCLGALVLAVVMTWPVMRDPRHTIAGDLWDPSLEAWQMAWAGWAVKHDPGRLWQTNAFHAERYAFAYSDTLLGYLPAGLLGNGMSDALLRYNVMFVLVFALAFVGAYALTRQLGANVAGAAVAGAAFAYAPWRWRWPCSRAATGTPSATGTGPSGPNRAGRWPAGSSRRGR